MTATKVYTSPRPGANPSFSHSSASPSPHSPEVGYHCLEEAAHESQHRTSAMIIQDFPQRNTGLFMITMAQCCFSSMNVAVKKLNGLDIPVPTMELIAVRMAQTALFSLAYMIATGVNDPFLGPKGIRLLLLFRGSIGFVGLTGFYLSLQYLSLSDATALSFLAPIFLVFTGAIFLGESFSLRQIFAGFVSLVGVILIAKPTFLFGPDAYIPHLWIGINAADGVTPRDRLFSVGMGLVGVISAITAYTTIRAIGKQAHAMHLLVYLSAVCIPCSMVSMVVTGTPIVVPTAIEWIFLMLLIGILGFIGQLLLTMGLQCETVGRGSMAMYTQIVFATIFQRIFFHSYPTLYSAVGIILISGSALYTAISKGETKTRDIRLPNDDDIEGGLLGQRAVDADPI